MIRILLVEDNPGDAMLIQHLVEPGGSTQLNFTHSDRLETAFEEWEKSPDFDIAILDLSLPDSDGAETVEKFHKKAPRVPIIVLTGLNDSDVGVDAVKKGAQDFLVKGKITEEAFLKTLHYSIERNKLSLFKDDLMSNVSHELRTPLTIIREAVSQLHDGILGELTEPQIKCAQMALNNVDRLRSLINDMLDTAKLEAGKVDLVIEKVNLCKLIAQIQEECLPAAQKKGLELKTNVPESVFSVFVDKNKIIQVFTNFFTNALKFTDQGSIELGVEEKDDFLQCYVKDTGKGISKEDLGKMFQKFEQVGRVDGPGAKGTGLGLTISKGLVELHKGEVKVESTEGKGSKFIFTLPKQMARDMFIKHLDKAIHNAKSTEGQVFVFVYVCEGLQVFGDKKQKVFDELTNAANQILRRKTDLVISGQDHIYVVISDVNAEAIQLLRKRIQESMDNYLKNEAHSDKIKIISAQTHYPDDGQHASDLVKKLNLT